MKLNMEKLKNEQLHCPFCNGEMHLKSSNYVGMNIFYLNFLCTGCAAYLSFKVKSRASSTEEIEELAFRTWHLQMKKLNRGGVALPNNL